MLGKAVLETTVIDHLQITGYSCIALNASIKHLSVQYHHLQVGQHKI
jgi:hypothetical protein